MKVAQRVADRILGRRKGPLVERFAVQVSMDEVGRLKFPVEDCRLATVPQRLGPRTRSAALARVMAEAKRWRATNSSSAISSCSRTRSMRWQVCEVMLTSREMRMPQSIAGPGGFRRKI
ncbi:hypothetical protein BZM27_44350 [Paraburkholderia steynii]|uniref:Uncharacterized protein n=1 Tax=Paraburkholderia steynii TaxID=1245441 RepID=A0A4R0X5A2_9BURK|nr:hypothetical protein BZM27_44350 [Paraburkholderia steynii]